MTTAQETRRLSLIDGGQLTLDRTDGNDLAGIFVRDGKVARFRSTTSREGQTFELRDAKEQLVLRVTANAETVAVRLFAENVIVSAPRGVKGAFQTPSPVATEEALARLLKSDAYVVLPNLAIELVHIGIVGDSDRFPAAQFVHGIGVASAAAQHLTMPSLDYSDDRRVLQPVSFLSKCTNLKHNPHGDSCYGMCGNGCTCWWPVCMTCCGCEGCQTHDYACRVTDCDTTLTPAQRAGYKTGCYTFAAFFIPLLPCARYEDGKYHTPCP